MSRSSASEGARGQVQPLPALVAVLALTLALTAYADVTQSLPSPGEPSPAVPALKRVEAVATTGAVLQPDALSPAAAGLEGHRVNVTLRTSERRLSAGPAPPETAQEASTRVAVDTDGRVRPGVLEVEVWPWTAA